MPNYLARFGLTGALAITALCLTQFVHGIDPRLVKYSLESGEPLYIRADKKDNSKCPKIQPRQGTKDAVVCHTYQDFLILEADQSLVLRSSLFS